MLDVRTQAGHKQSVNEACKFCALARGELPATVVFEWRDAFAFLDHRPLFPGHCLLVPRDHIETLDDLPAERVGPFFQIVQMLAAAVEKAMEAEGTFIAINNRVSQSVPHLHVHVVPRRKGDGLRGFFWPRQKYPDAATERQAAQAVRKALAASGAPRALGG
jgi:histidine triad (HIT) family protein